jgi:putative ABC transport system permease protein
VTTALVRKSWTDLSRRRARTVLTVLTLTLAVASFGILALPSLMNGAMTAEVSQARLYDLWIPVDDVALTPAQLQHLAQIPGVSAMAARSMFTTRTLVGSRRVDTEIWGVADFGAQPVDRVLTSTAPGPGQVLVDVRDAMSNISSAHAGSMLTVQGADGSYRPLRVAGSAFALAFNQDTLTGDLVLYGTQATVQALGGYKGVDLLEFRLVDPSQSAAQTVVTAVRSYLGALPHPSSFTNAPRTRAPGDWPLKAIFNSRSEILDILVVLAVISALFLLANTIRTLVAEQSREIGVMQVVGASAQDVRNSYLRSAAYLGLMGATAGAAVGIGLAYLLLRLFARMVYGITAGFAVDWPVVVLGAAAGFVATMLTAWPTLRRVLHMPVHEALASEGPVPGFGAGRLDHAVLRSRALPPPVRIGVRNIARQKGRSLATIVQVALAVATLLGLMSLALAVSQVTDQSWDVLDFDITLNAQPGGTLYGSAVVEQVRAQPGVAAVEAADWYDMTYQGQTVYALGVHADTLVREPLAAGRWFSPGEQQAGAKVAIVGSAAARRWHLRPGSRLTITTPAGPVAFTVVGVGASQADNGYNFYTSLTTLQSVTGRPGLSNSLFVRSTDPSHSAIDALSARLENLLYAGGHPSRAQEMYAGRATDEANASGSLVVVEGIGLLIVAISMLGLVNAITMSIIERTREIGVLRSLGATARDLRRIFRTETTSLALMGFVLAVPLGWVISRVLQWLVLHVAGAALPAPYTLESIGVAFAGTVLLAVLVVIAPLRRATRLRPGEAIRYS